MLHVILILVFLFFFFPIQPCVFCLFVSTQCCNHGYINHSIFTWTIPDQPTVSTKRFRVSSTSRNMDSMPGTPATFASYCDPASPAPSHHPHSRSNSLVAKMDLEMSGASGGCNDSDDGGPTGTKAHPMSKT